MGLVDTLKQEFDLTVEWLGFEIHPETPPEGMPLIKMFPRADVDGMTRRLNSMGTPFGLTFRKIVNISNSRLSLEAGEFAKEHGRFDQYQRCRPNRRSPADRGFPGAAANLLTSATPLSPYSSP